MWCARKRCGVCEVCVNYHDIASGNIYLVNYKDVNERNEYILHKLNRQDDLALCLTQRCRFGE